MTTPSLRFKVLPSPESNDHEVRILVDEKDLISFLPDEMLGIDPFDFLADPALSASGKLVYARCGCGVVGCGWAEVQVTWERDFVQWTGFVPDLSYASSLRFSRAEFEEAVSNARNDHSWETPERAAERLVSALDFSGLAKHGLRFEWASGRIRPDAMTLCLLEGSLNQMLASTPWDHRNPEDAVRGVAALLALPPQRWPDVIYYPQGQNLPPPGMAGPGWRRA